MSANAVDDAAEDVESGETPKLPDVPTDEPAEAGQPDAKKRKVGDGEATGEAKSE